ncbi:MAG TPA: SRPBCC family protein [Solirubrobacteraceae bacterium]|nr:SRPBCC family protein [Solirubrobacteraceae bacterium]
MDPVTVSVTIDKPREEVFDYLADIANHPEFMDHFLKEWRLTRVESYGRGAGARFRVEAPLQRFGWADMTFLEVQPPHRIVAVGRGGKYNRVKSYTEWRLEPAPGGGTRVEMTHETEPALPSDRLMEIFAGRGWFRRRARKGLKRLQAILEEGRERGQRATVAGL